MRTAPRVGQRELLQQHRIFARLGQVQSGPGADDPGANNTGPRHVESCLSAWVGVP